MVGLLLTPVLSIDGIDCTMLGAWQSVRVCIVVLMPVQSGLFDDQPRGGF